MPFSDRRGGKSGKETVQNVVCNMKTELPFLSGACISIFDCGNAHKTKFNKLDKLDFSFSSFYSSFFFVLIPFLFLSLLAFH